MDNQREAAAVATSSVGAISESESEMAPTLPSPNTMMATTSVGLSNSHALASIGSGVSPIRPSLAVTTGRSPITANKTLTAPNETGLIGNNGTPPKTPIFRKNPKDTATYISPGGMGGASPKRRMKSMNGMHTTNLDFCHDPFSSGGGTNNYGASNFAGSGGGSVGMVGGAAGMGNGGRVGGNSVGGSIGGASSGFGGATVKSAKSVPTSYLTAARMAPPYAANHASGNPTHQRTSTPTSSSPVLNPLNGMMLTPGSVDSLHSMKDINHGTSNVNASSGAPNITVETRSSNQHNSMSNIHTMPNSHNPPTASTHKHSLDDEEQFMFEQRLTQDELGVAIRKISHSGKAQLRYVKCVPLRPPSSSDYLEMDLKTNSAQERKSTLTMPYLDAHARPKLNSDSISVSSKSSTGSRFMERMRNTTSSMGMRRLISSGGNPSATVGEGRAGGANGGLKGDKDDGLLLQNDADKLDKSLRALTWGKKNAVMLSLDKFTCVRKGKTTERTVRNSSPSSRLLSIITSVRGNESLDIEAPTMLDRDKFASAFARFLGVPLVEEESGRGVRGRASVGGAKKKIRTPSLTRNKKRLSAAHSEPGPLPLSPSLSSTPKIRNRTLTNTSDSLLPALTPNSDKASDADRELAFDVGAGNSGEKQTIGSRSRRVSDNDFSNAPLAAPTVSGIGATVGTANGSSQMDRHAGDAMETMSKHTLETMSESARKRISLDVGGQGESMLEPRTSSTPVLPQDGMGGGSRPDPGEANSLDPNGPTIHARKEAHHHRNHDDNDNHSHVSSLTGGVDQEIVEELHQAIIELRSELDASRAEAARAVKVAEQAIQSAENNTASDWNSTVTHKAAEAAAQAQKKSAEAIARARMAEERLSAERKSTSFWRRQAQAAEEEAGSLKTRSAASEIKQAVMMEELASERRKAARLFASLKHEFVHAEKRQGEEMTMIQERKRGLEMELEEVREEMEKHEVEARRAIGKEMERKEKSKGPNRMKPNFRRTRSTSAPREKKSGKSSPIPNQEPTPPENEAAKQRITTLQTEVTSLRKQFELVRHTSMDEILSLHRQSEEWSNQASRAVAASTAETDHLREKLAAEGAMRLKLLNELQDIRGTVRVYCRPKPCVPGKGKAKSILKIPTHDILVLNEDTSPMSFKYDRVFSPGASQYEVFSELEEPLISSLDGFNVTLLAFGQGGSGKTHTLLGDVSLDDADAEGERNPNLPSLKSYGVQLQAIQQLFTIAGHRTDRYKDAFFMTMVEVHNEKLSDLVSGTPSAERDGEVVICETRDRLREKQRGRESLGLGANESAAGWRKGKLEMRTNIDGNTVVQGLVSIPIKSFEEAVAIWRESIAQRAERLLSQGCDVKMHERKTNVITTIHITSVNIATGVGTEGKLQFVDMASSDTVRGVKKPREDHNGDANNMVEEDETQFGNTSIDAFNDVINARCQFDRSVPYRNSTLTHLLRDSLEADTKVLLMCCVSSEQAHLANTVGALRFAARMQKVSIGKATKHIIGSKE